KNIIIKPAPSVKEKQERLLQGQVRDEQGQPVIGASITIKGDLGKSTKTNDRGIFSLEVEQGQIITVSFVGFEKQEIGIRNQQHLQITLLQEQTGLDEVVVIGYGTQKRSNVIAPVSTMQADGLEERPITRVDQALVGQMAGVHVKQTTGVPGKGFSVQVRGSGSITAGREPLYVLDGFPLAVNSQNSNGGYTNGNPLDNINPNDIESIQVLKDASAAAIYGSRASNGVVLITTKQGKAGVPKINVNTYLGGSTPYRKLDMLSSEEWIDRSIEMINGQWVASGAGRTASQSMDERRAILGLSPGTYNTSFMYDERWLQDGYPGLHLIDWQEEAYRTGLVQNYQLGASGGTEFVNYYISGNYMDQKGIVRGVDYKNYALRANVDVRPTKKLAFGMNLAPTYSEANDPGVEGKDNIMHQLYSMSPVQENPAGMVNVFDNARYPWSTSTNDPIAKLNHYDGENKTARILATLYGQYNILDNLVFKTTVNLDHTDYKAFRYRPYTVGGDLPQRTTRPNFATYGSNSTYRKQTFVNDNTVTYTLERDRHNLTALLGHAYNYDRFDASSITSQGGYRNSNVKTLNAAVGTTASTDATKNLMLSYFGRVQYAFDSKYLL